MSSLKKNKSILPDCFVYNGRYEFWVCNTIESREKRQVKNDMVKYDTSEKRHRKNDMSGVPGNFLWVGEIFIFLSIKMVWACNEA